MSFGDGIAIVFSTSGVSKIINRSGFAIVYNHNNEITYKLNANNNINTICKKDILGICSTIVNDIDYLPYTEKLKEKRMYVHEKNIDSVFNFNELSITVVDDNHSNIQLFSNSINSVSVLVESERPPSGIAGSAGTGNGGLNNIQLIIQKNNYFECKLDITNTTVTDIIGLPPGIVFNDDKLRGSATVSGKYYITIRLEDGSGIEGSIEVLQLQRKF